MLKINSNKKSRKESSRILIIDDDEAIRNTLESFFLNNGYQTCSASTDTEALEHLKNEKIDIVITDILRPGAGGLELTRRIKTHYDVSVIILSGTVSDINTPEKCFDAGASAVFPKPAKLADILDSAKSILKKR